MGFATESAYYGSSGFAEACLCCNTELFAVCIYSKYLVLDHNGTTES